MIGLCLGDRINATYYGNLQHINRTPAWEREKKFLTTVQPLEGAVYGKQKNHKGTIRTNTWCRRKARVRQAVYRITKLARSDTTLQLSQVQCMEPQYTRMYLVTYTQRTHPYFEYYSCRLYFTWNAAILSSDHPIHIKPGWRKFQHQYTALPSR